MPCASVRRWCLLPVLPRSVGLGPVFFHPKLHARNCCRRRRETNRFGLPCGVCATTLGASVAKRPHVATRAIVANKSYLNRSPFPVEVTPRESRFSRQTECPLRLSGGRAVFVQDGVHDDAGVATKVRSGSTVHHQLKIWPWMCPFISIGTL
jgi:hypothetical protein